MRALRLACCCALGLVGCEHAGPPSARPGTSTAVARPTPPPVGQHVAPRTNAFCFTEGDAEPLPAGLLRIREPKARAVLPESNGDSGRLAFRYHGETRTFSALKSGARRRQLGLKLRARDACNLIYVMWRLEPKAELVVSFKNNPDASSSSECGNEGYVTLRPVERSSVPELRPETDHTLDADIVGSELVVRTDGNVAWRGELPGAALALSGPSGFRSDNVDWSVRNFETVAGKSPFFVSRCRRPLHSVSTSGDSGDSGASSASSSPSE